VENKNRRGSEAKLSTDRRQLKAKPRSAGCPADSKARAGLSHEEPGQRHTKGEGRKRIKGGRGGEGWGSDSLGHWGTDRPKKEKNQTIT